MPFVQVDPSQVKFDAPQNAQAQSGFIEVDPAQIKFDAPKLSQQPGFLSNSWNAVSNRWQQAQQDTHNYPAMAPVIGLGATAGSINDVIGQGINAAVPDIAKQGLSTGADYAATAIEKTGVGQLAGDALLKANNAYDSFMQNNPKTAIALRTAGNVTSLLPVAKAAKPAAQEITSIAQNASNGLKGLSEMYAAKYPMGKGPLDAVSNVGHELTPQALETGATLRYNSAAQMGGVIKPGGFQDTLNAIKQKVGYQTPEGMAFAGENHVTDIINKLDKMQEMPISLKGLDEMDGTLRSKISMAMRAGDNESASKLLEIKSMLKNASNTVKPEDLVNPQAFEEWRAGDALWTAKSKMQELQGMVDNAYLTDNPDTAMRAGYRSLSKRLDKNPQGWTPEEIATIQQGAKRGLAAGALKAVSGRLMSHLTALALGGAGGVAGGPIGAALGFAAGEAAGFPMRAAGNALQEGRAMAPLKMVANRPSVAKALPQSVAEISKLPMAEQKAALDALLKSGQLKPRP